MSPSPATLPSDGLLTRREAARFLRVGVDAIAMYIRHREDPLPFLQMGRRQLFERDALVRYCRRAAERAIARENKRRSRSPATARAAR